MIVSLVKKVNSHSNKLTMTQTTMITSPKFVKTSTITQQNATDTLAQQTITPTNPTNKYPTNMPYAPSFTQSLLDHMMNMDIFT
mmetsp:Transcript_21929/g.26866  ORF Transcript_21929/g.26866 Transcript_21929/m.26866 type:complete len:84 (-) Transcript_21929:647-898(-)